MVGFSITREYSIDLKYKYLRTAKGKADEVALIHVIYNFPPNEKSLPKVSERRFPIYLRISLYSQYLRNHYDYFYEDAKSPSKESVQEKLRTKSYRPIDLESIDEYFYNVERYRLETLSGEEISGSKILEYLFQQHIRPSQSIRGLFTRLHIKLWKFSQINFKHKIDFLLQLTIKSHVWLINNGCGRSLLNKGELPGLITDKWYSAEDFTKLKGEYLDILGYKAPPGIVIIFSVINLILYSLYYYFGIELDFYISIITTQYIALAFTIFGMSILEIAMPFLLRNSMNMFIKIRYRLWKSVSK